MPTLAVDVVVVRASPASVEYHGSDFYLKFSGVHTPTKVFQTLGHCIDTYDVVAFNDVDRDFAVKNAARASMAKTVSAAAGGGVISNSSNIENSEKEHSAYFLADSTTVKVPSAVVPSSSEVVSVAAVAAAEGGSVKASTSGNVNGQQETKLKYSIPAYISDQVQWVDIYRDQERCRDVIALVSHTRDNFVIFLDKRSGKFSKNPSGALLRDSFHLQAGKNNMSVVLRSSKVELPFSIYLYEVTDKLVVMDIDGTITRTDVRGYFESVYMQRYTHVHDGVIVFLNYLHYTLGYNIFYLTSRPIAHMPETRLLLENAFETVAEVKFMLPRGPLFAHRVGTSTAIYAELISKSVASFKYEAMNDINGLFKQASITMGAASAPSVTKTPFILGIGNRKTDMDAYREAGVATGRRLLIDPCSSIVVDHDDKHSIISSEVGKDSVENKQKWEAQTWKQVPTANPTTFNGYSDSTLTEYILNL